MKKAAYPAFALLGVIWGSNFIFMKWAAAEISPSQIVLLRVAFGFVPIFLFALAKRALQWEHIRYVHHFAVMSVLATAIYYFTPLKLPAVALATYQIGLAMIFLLLATSLHGIGAVFKDTRAWTGLIFGLGLLGTGVAYVIYYRRVKMSKAINEENRGEIRWFSRRSPCVRTGAFCSWKFRPRP